MNSFAKHLPIISLFSFIFLMVMLAEYIAPIHHNMIAADAMMASSFISICLLNTNVCCLLLPSIAAILNGVCGGVNVVEWNSFEVMSGEVMSGDVVSGALVEPFDAGGSECELRSS